MPSIRETARQARAHGSPPHAAAPDRDAGGVCAVHVPGAAASAITSRTDARTAPASRGSEKIVTCASTTSSPPRPSAFLTDLQREFGERRLELLARRAERLRRLTGGAGDGELPDFLPETADVRDGDWRVAPIPDEIADRRVEITGPVDRKMVINALNSGAKVFMADFEDSNSPTWENCIEGQRNLTDALERTISLDTGEKQYTLERRGRGAVRAAARLAPRGAALRGRRRADVGLAVRLRPLLLPQPRAERALLLPAEARVAPRGAALERRLHLVAGAARRRARDDQGDRPDRDDPRRVRDGRDPLRAARPLGRAQRRPLGLHLQRDQEARPPARDGAARPRRA